MLMWYDGVVLCGECGVVVRFTVCCGKTAMVVREGKEVWCGVLMGGGVMLWCFKAAFVGISKVCNV